MTNDPNSNPFAAGQVAQPEPLGAQKSSVPKILGVINIVFAGMGLFGLLISFGMLFLMSNVDFGPGENPVGELMQNNDSYRIFMMITMFLGAVFTFVLLIAGFGLLQYRRYGRTFSIAYAVYTIIAAIVGVVANYFFIVQPMFEGMQGNDAAATGGMIGGVVGGTFGACFGMIYPIILLFFMFKQSVVETLE